MHRVVVDSSVILKWLNQKDELYLEKAEAILQDAKEGQIQLLAPELAKFEVGNALLVGKKLSLTQGKETLEFLFSLPISFITETEELAKSTFEIGQKLDITYYDAAFLALAKQEKAVLVTDNVKHQRKTTDIKIVPLAKYK